MMSVAAAEIAMTLVTATMTASPMPNAPVSRAMTVTGVMTTTMKSSAGKEMPTGFADTMKTIATNTVTAGSSGSLKVPGSEWIKTRAAAKIVIAKVMMMEAIAMMMRMK